MKYSLLAVVILLAVGAVAAEDLVSGLSTGSSVPAFQVVKVSGPEDGVKNGKSLCYR